MPLTPGQILLQRYRIDGRLGGQSGQGGAGTVYQAWDLHLDRPRALKENLGVSPEAQAAFRREAQILADLRHPNLPRVIDHFLIPGQGQYLVMDYVEGEDLASLVRRVGPLPQARALAWISYIFDAVAYLHHLDPPVIHGDIKPANIRITPNGTPMLVDFGMPGASTPGEALERPARTGGYHPPEQAEPGGIDPRSDVYALGATLYTLLTGVTPADSAAMRAGRAPRLPKAHEANRQVSAGVGAAIDYAMQLDQSRRYATIEAFQTALTVGALGGPVEPPRLDRRGLPTQPAPVREAPDEASPSAAVRPGESWEQGPEEQAGRASVYPVPGRPGAWGAAVDLPVPAPAGQAGRRSLRPWGWLALGALALVGLCLLAGAWLWRTLDGRVAQPPPALPAASLTPLLPGTGATRPAVDTPPGPAASPGAPGSTAPAVVTPTGTPTAAASATPAQIPWQQGRLAWLQDNPAGMALYFQAMPGQADPSLVATGPLLAPLWAPDGSRLALYNRSGQLLVVEAAPGAAPQALGRCIFPSWSGDGSVIGCSASSSPSYRLINPANGEQVAQVPLPSRTVLPVLSPAGNEIAYSVQVDGSTTLWRMGLDGSQPVQLAGDASENYAPAWSPDGLQIAYQSNEGGGMSEIWVVGREGGRRQLTQTPNNGWSRAPAWSPDGQWLAFVSNQAGSIGPDFGEIFVVSVSTGEVFQVTDTGGSVYDWRVSWGR